MYKLYSWLIIKSVSFSNSNTITLRVYFTEILISVIYIYIYIYIHDVYQKDTFQNSQLSNFTEVVWSERDFLSDLSVSVIRFYLLYVVFLTVF